jgi:glucose-6-phosphate isomerase
MKLHQPPCENQASEVLRFQNSIKTKNLKYFILVGIGGANLGTKAVYEALRLHKLHQTPEVIFIDTLQSLPELSVEPHEVLINVVTKSEATLETNTNLIHLLKKYPQYKDRIIHTTSQERKEPHLKIPEKVGDRYSIFSPLGLFPLSSAHANIMFLLEGAMQARKDCLEKDILKNPAMLLATINYLHYRKKKTSM